MNEPVDEKSFCQPVGLLRVMHFRNKCDHQISLHVLYLSSQSLYISLSNSLPDFTRLYLLQKLS